MGSNASCPVQGCDLPVDVVLKSSDEQIIGTHAANLEIFSCGFPLDSRTASSSSTSNPVCMTETAEVLHLLLGFMHRQRQPDLFGHGSDVVMSLAEAAEKYVVYSAMEICRLHMFRMSDDFPKDAFVYASQHGYPEVLNKTAPMTLNWDAEAACEALGVTNFALWTLYREKWLKISQNLPRLDVPVLHEDVKVECAHWIRFLGRIGEMGIEGLMNWKDRCSVLVSEVDCKWCRRRAAHLKSQVERELGNLPPASALNMAV